MDADTVSHTREDAYIGLGANLGDAARALADAVRRIGALPSTELAACSSVYRSAPVDATGPDFFNAVIGVRTGLTPRQLLQALQRIEADAGRQRPYPNAPRTLDLDILLFGDRRIDTPTLSLPHPRMLQRAFVLQPLAEIAPHCVSAAMLHAVDAQRIERFDVQDWAAPAPAPAPTRSRPHRPSTRHATPRGRP